MRNDLDLDTITFDASHGPSVVEGHVRALIAEVSALRAAIAAVRSLPGMPTGGDLPDDVGAWGDLRFADGREDAYEDRRFGDA